MPRQAFSKEDKPESFRDLTFFFQCPEIKTNVAMLVCHSYADGWTNHVEVTNTRNSIARAQSVD